MKKYIKTTISLLLATILCFVCPVFAEVNKGNLDMSVENTATYIQEIVEQPTVSSVGGEWAVIGLAQSGVEVPEVYLDGYYSAVETYEENCQGILHDRKYTEYSRVILALSAIGKNPEDVAEYNLLTPLGDFEKTTWQGINGAIWALIALDSMDYPMPENPEAQVQATRDLYVEDILSRQLESGGWNLSDKGGTGIADADITGMVWQALSPYQERADVEIALAKSIDCMSNMQSADGGFSSGGITTAESVAQIIIGLAALEMDLEDVRFVKNGNTLLDHLFTYKMENNGFIHTVDGEESNQMATEQGFLALVAAKRSLDGNAFLYDMKKEPVELVEENILTTWIQVWTAKMFG